MDDPEPSAFSPELGLPRTCMSSFTTDGAANLRKAVRLLDAPDWTWCVCHRIHLAVNAATLEVSVSSYFSSPVYVYSPSFSLCRAAKILTTSSLCARKPS